MIATQQEIAALENFFASINLPTELELNKALTYRNLPAFVNENLEKLKNGSMSDVVGKPRYNDLLEIKAALITGSGK